MADVTTDINQSRAIRIARKRVEGFAEQFGEAHRNLSRHAAFPLVLTPDLLYQIWANFVPEAPWVAVAHVLLSRLCRQVGYEMYEMDIADRNLLLRELKEEFGQERFDELGEFLLDYVAQRLSDDDADTQDLREAQEWTALAYTKPDEAARELAQRLSEMVHKDNMEEVLRLVALVETLTEPLMEAGFDALLIYISGMQSFVRGDLKEARAKFSEKQIKRGSIKVAAIDLKLPEQLLTNVDEIEKFIPTKLHEEKLAYPEDVENLLRYIKVRLTMFHLATFYEPEEILHIALLRKNELLASGEKIANTSVWLRATCQNIIREYSKNHSISSLNLLRTIPIESVEYLRDSDERSPDAFVNREESKNIQQEIYSILKKQITQLSPNTQELLQMYYGKSLSQMMIARELNLTQSNVARKLKEVRRLLVGELIKWSKQTPNISVNKDSDLIKHIDTALAEYLYSYYATKS